MPHLEGRVSVIAALEARRRRIDLVVVASGSRVEDVQAAAGARGVPVKEVSRDEIDAMAHGRSHGGVVAVCGSKPPADSREIEEIAERCAAPFLLLLEGIDDARNLAFILRTAEALGVDAVLLKRHLWDFDEAEVSRSSSGAFERMPMGPVDEPLLKSLQRRAKLWGCIPGVKTSIHEADLSGGVILAVGGEKRGLSGAVRGICDGFVRIPMARDIGSLSASHAAAIAMAEVARRRA